MKRGYYYVVTKDEWCGDAIVVGSKKRVVLAFYKGDGEWDTELLYGENYKCIPVYFPSVEEVESLDGKEMK